MEGVWQTLGLPSWQHSADAEDHVALQFCGAVCLSQLQPLPITSQPPCFTGSVTAWPPQALEFGTPMCNLKFSFKPPITVTPYTGNSVGPQSLTMGLTEVSLQSRLLLLHCF